MRARWLERVAVIVPLALASALMARDILFPSPPRLWCDGSHDDTDAFEAELEGRPYIDCWGGRHNAGPRPHTISLGRSILLRKGHKLP